MNVVAGNAGEIIDHMHSVTPMTGYVLFVAVEAAGILVGNGVGPARSKTDIWRGLGWRSGMIGALPVTVGTREFTAFWCSVGALQYCVYR